MSLRGVYNVHTSNMYVEQYKTMYSVYVGSELLDNDNSTTRNVFGLQCRNRVAATNISEMQ